MRYLILLLALLTYTQVSASEIAILGKIQSPKDSIVVLSIPPSEIGGDYIQDTFYLNSKNAFRFRLHLAKATMATIRHAYIKFPIFIHPEHSLVIRLSANSDSKAVVNFKGRGSHDNQFYANYLNHLNKRLENKSLEQIEKTSSRAYKKFVLERAEQQRVFVKKHQKKLSPQLISWVNNDIEYRAAELLINYPILLRQSNKFIKSIELPNFYYDFLKQVKLNNEAAMLQPSYQDFITSYFYNYQAIGRYVFETVPHDGYSNYTLDNRISSLDGMYNYVDDFFNGTPRYYVQSVLIRNEIQVFPDSVDTRYYNYLLSDAPVALKQQVKKVYTQRDYTTTLFNQILAGEHIPVSAFRQINNSTLPHDLFEDKISYLFFWSENSSKSIMEIKYFKHLAKKYKDHPNVNIILVNTDEGIKEWERAAIQFKYQLNGLNVKQLHLHESALPKSLKEYFNFHIPSFLIVGSEGRILNDQNLAPSSRKVPQVLEKHLSNLGMSDR